MKKQLLALSLLATIMAPQTHAETEKVAFDAVGIGNVFSKTQAEAICTEEIEVSKTLALKNFKESLLENENLSTEEIEKEVKEMEEELSKTKFTSVAIRTTPDLLFGFGRGIPRYTACQIYKHVEVVEQED